jgi:hypothetical protein
MYITNQQFDLFLLPSRDDDDDRENILESLQCALLCWHYFPARSHRPTPSSCNKRYPFSLQCWFKRFSRIIKRLMYSLVWLGKGDARELIWRDFLPQHRRFEPSAPKAICADRDFGWKNIYDDIVVPLFPPRRHPAFVIERFHSRRIATIFRCQMAAPINYFWISHSNATSTVSINLSSARIW